MSSDTSKTPDLPLEALERALEKMAHEFTQETPQPEQTNEPR